MFCILIVAKISPDFLVKKNIMDRSFASFANSEYTYLHISLKAYIMYSKMQSHRGGFFFIQRDYRFTDLQINEKITIKR
jgi:hypothetical protein